MILQPMFPSMANKYQFHKLTWCKRHYLHAIGAQTVITVKTT